MKTRTTPPPVTWIAWIALAVLLLPACGDPDTPHERIASSDQGMVVSAEPLATEVGVEILEAGGNAVDAAVATAFALGVVEPSMSGIGGRNNMVIRSPDGEVVGIDGFTEVPAEYEPREGDGSIGYPTIGIPGAVAGLAQAQEDHGTMSLEEVMAPAIELAEEGYPLPEGEARRMEESAEEHDEYEEWREIFLRPDGSTYAPSDVFRQPDLASTLRAIAEGGPDAFYQGQIARKIAEDMKAHDAHLTYDDLAGYQAVPAILARGSYRDHEVVGTHLPASGTTSIQALHIMERADTEIEVGTAGWAALTGQALAHAFNDRTLDLGDPEEKASRLTSTEWAEQRAEEIRLPDPVASVSDASGLEKPMAETTALPDEPSHTTHLSTADADGGVVALTASLGSSFGSHVVTPGLGFVYASTLQYTDVLPGTPRKRPMTSQSPLLVLEDNEPVLVLGGAGGRRIVSAVVSVVSRSLDEGLPLPEAMDAPRVHALGSGEVELEEGGNGPWPDGAADTLRASGFEVTEGSGIARIHGISRDPATGALTGVADRRGDGTAAGSSGH